MDMGLGRLWELAMDREAWRAVVHRVTKSWTWLSDWTELNQTEPNPSLKGASGRGCMCFTWGFTPVLGFFLCSPFVGFSPFFVCLLAAMILDSLFYSNYLTDSITDSMDMNLSKLWKIVKDRRASCATVHGLTKSQTRLSDWTENIRLK